MLLLFMTLWSGVPGHCELLFVLFPHSTSNLITKIPSYDLGGPEQPNPQEGAPQPKPATQVET